MTHTPIPLTAQDLWDLLTLELWTGKLYPKKADSYKRWDPSQPLGTKKPAPNGYHYITFGKRKVLAHRVVYKWIHAIDPLVGIEHRDGIKTNNMPFNLQIATHT